MSRTILGKRPALAAEGEKQVFSSPNSVLISPCEHPNDIWTQPKVSSEENASRLPPIRSLFFHHYDWNRWFASLATTVDNTIKMADRSFKHGRQWCIRRINMNCDSRRRNGVHFFGKAKIRRENKMKKTSEQDTGFVLRQILIWKCAKSSESVRSAVKTQQEVLTTVCKMYCVCKMQSVGCPNSRLVHIFAAAFDWRILPPYQNTLA